MSLSFRLVALASLLVLSACNRNEPQKNTQDDTRTKSDLEKFQGSWSTTSAEQNGIAGNKDQLADVKWACEGDKCTIKLGTTVVDYTISLDQSKDPKTIDMLMTSGPRKGEIFKGIYKFIDDELILCTPADNKDGARPKEFTGKAGSDQVLTVMKRNKH